MKSNTASASSCNCTHRFYLSSSIVLLVLTVIGFRFFYFHGQAFPGRELTPPIRSLLMIHGIIMSLWMLLSVAQPLLINVGNRRLHMSLGRFGAVLVAVMFVVGWKVGIAATKVNPPEMTLFGLVGKQFMVVPTLGVTFLALFVAIGVWQRRRPEIHRPMMLMASLSAVPAAIGRIPLLNYWWAGTVWEQLFSAFFSTILIAALLIAGHFVIIRRVDRWLLGSFAGYVVICLAISLIGKTALWERFASYLIG